MAEIGIDISNHHVKDIAEFDEQEMDYLIAVCDAGTCPVFPWAKEEIHEAPPPDPSRLTGSDEEVMVGMRRIRDEITAWIDATFGDGLV